MRWPAPLIRGRLIKRYKRFLADVVLDGGEETTVHCPNPGRMLGLDHPGETVWVSRSPNLKRKLPLTLELVEADGGLVGINTMHPNRLMEEAIRADAIPSLAGYPRLRREVAYDQGCRIDLLLEGDDRPPCYVEVKNVHLKRDREAEFPDCVTARGAKHLAALSRQVASGARAVIAYVVQRSDCSAFSLAGDIDPTYEAAFEKALESGVEALCHDCSIDQDEILLASPLPIVI
ncbi:MAG: DNA/RNA nuclease SfsA [Geminicoccaceae bacterium]